MIVVRSGWLSGRGIACLLLIAGCWGCAGFHKGERSPYDLESRFRGHTAAVAGAQPRVSAEASHDADDDNKEPTGAMNSEDLERRGDAYMARGSLQVAYIQYAKALSLKSDSVDLRCKKGMVCLLGRVWEEAAREFEEVLEKEPHNALAHQGMGQALFFMKRYDEAQGYLSKALEYDRSLWKCHALLGIISDYKGDHRAAADQYRAALSLRPDNGALYNNLGVSYVLVADYRDAIEAFNGALERGFSESKLYNNLGVALFLTGRDKEALEAFSKAGDRTKAYNNLGCMYLKQGDCERAAECFVKALELRPTFYAKAHENLQRCRLACGGLEPNPGYDETPASAH